MIDTGIDQSHPTLRDAAITARSFLPDGAEAEENGHGTAIAAMLVGERAPGAAPLAPGAQLLAAGVFRAEGDALRADAFAVVRGLDWAIGAGARVIAMSIEGADNAVLARAVRASAARANLVAAGGNRGPDGAAAYPAAYPQVIAVSAVDARLRPYRAGNRGSYLEIAAPGVGVVSAGGAAGRQAWSGSSFAVPYVAAALLRARAETAGDPIAARRLLAEQTRDLGPPGRDPIFGYGLLQTSLTRCW
ncbi:MAG: S8 family serine peptidase [Pseudomonadota bacterium]